MSDVEREETIQARRQRLSVIPRACEACRIRKTRCDRTSPCSNCRASGIACRPIKSTPEVRTKPDRVTQLEKLVESLSKRLALVEDKQRCHDTTPDLARITAVSTSHSPDSGSNATADCLYEGRSSFNIQSAQASEVAKKKVDTGGLSGGSEFDASITYLASLLDPSSSGTSSAEDYFLSPSPATRLEAPLTPLPIDLLVAIVHRIKSRPTLNSTQGSYVSPSFLCSYFLANPPMVMNSFPVNDASLIENMCQKVCFPTEAVSIGQVTAMHGMIYFILKELVGLKDPLCKEFDLKLYLKKCEQKFHAGLETYDVMAIPNFENIFVLTLGIVKALSEAKLLLCSSLMSAAVNHCQMLGYHSETSYRNDTPRKADSKRRLFWTLYVFDKSNSLLLGHASKIHDSEVDIQLPTLSIDPGIRPWEEIFLLYIQISGIQGKIYSNLYSPAALKSPSSERARHIQDLKAAMEKWRIDLAQVDCTKVKHEELLCLSKECWDIIYYSTLTLLFRASSMPGSAAELTSECFQAARLCLQTHIRCFSAYMDCDILTEQDYANSIFYFSSFTPFLVVFLHALAVSSIEDVQLLESVSRILEKIRRASKATERLYQICATFARLARGLVESQSSCLGTYNEQDDSLLFSAAATEFTDLRPADLQEFFGPNMMDYITDSEALDMSTILSDWATGPPSAAGFFGNTSGEHHY